MKIKGLFLSIIFVSSSLCALVGCKSKVKSGGSNTIQIKAYKGGYGTEFMHELADKFVTIYPEYKVEFVEESGAIDYETIGAEIAVPKNNQIDLYFVTGLDINHILTKSYAALRERDVVLFEPLDEIFEGKAIGLDGKEEAETIKSRFFNGFEELCKYNGEFPKWRGKMFTLPWAESACGLFVNKAVLDKYNQKIPLTSNEFVSVLENISTQGKADDKYPFAWGGSNTTGYWHYLFETWFAQYSGTESFSNFMNCIPESGNIKLDGYKVYEDQGILKSLEDMFRIMDLNYVPAGSASKSHMEAQTEFVTGRCAFMANGDWVMHEMKRDYYEQAKNILMIGMPILSSIGTEIGITDEQLHTLVEMIDAHKSDAEIKAAISGLSDAGIDRVRKARSVYNTRGIGHNIAIPSYADAKDAAKLFVRFLYSNDGCRIYRNFANANLPLSYTPEESDEHNPFQESLDKIRNYDNPTIITDLAPFNGVRETAAIYVFNNPLWADPNTFKDVMVDKNKKPENQDIKSAQNMFEKEQEHVRNKWPEFMTYIDYL